LFYVNSELEKSIVLLSELSPKELKDEDGAWYKAWLAGDVMLEIGVNRVEQMELGRELRDRIRGRLAQLLRLGRLAARERVSAGDSLARLGDPRFRADAWFLPDEPLLGFVEVPEGSFLMGSDKKQDKEAVETEMPQHKIDLPTYYIARYPVTVAQYEMFVKDGGYGQDRYWKEAEKAGV
jgi:formylglycine-generating enzyme required for sulfatase activity